MRRQLLPALRMIVVATVVLGLVYPLAMTGLAQGLFGNKADGSLLEVDGKVVGSSLVGQEFTSPQYFHGRPSAAGALASGSMVQDTDEDGNPVGAPHPADPTDLSAAASGASNQGPTNPDLLASVKELTAAYRAENGLGPDVEVPIDAVTASGSGVDPQISIENARLQALRVAKERGLSLGQVLTLVAKYTDGRSLGFLGEKGVNVLELNLSLDRVTG
jgi:K+-transporting ATPase ATPase C chain